MSITQPVPEPVATGEPYWTIGRLALSALVVAMIAFWGWIFLFAPRDNPDSLADTRFPEQAESICAATQTAIDDLPSPRETLDPADRAVQVAIGTDLTRAMVADLRRLTDDIDTVEERELVDLWFDDWDVYIDDRIRHVEKLEAADADTSGRDLAFTLRARAAGGIYTRRIDGFANVNDMESCHTPGDI
jgi:hypothetical protein